MEDRRVRRRQPHLDLAAASSLARCPAHPLYTAQLVMQLLQPELRHSKGIDIAVDGESDFLNYRYRRFEQQSVVDNLGIEQFEAGIVRS